MVQKHQIAQYLLYLTPFVVNMYTKYIFVPYLSPVMLKKHQMAQFLLYLTSFAASVHNKYIFWYIWPQY